MFWNTKSYLVLINEPIKLESDKNIKYCFSNSLKFRSGLNSQKRYTACNRVHQRVEATIRPNQMTVYFVHDYFISRNPKNPSVGSCRATLYIIMVVIIPPIVDNGSLRKMTSLQLKRHRPRSTVPPKTSYPPLGDFPLWRHRHRPDTIITFTLSVMSHNEGRIIEWTAQRVAACICRRHLRDN